MSLSARTQPVPNTSLAPGETLRVQPTQESFAHKTGHIDLVGCSPEERLHIIGDVHGCADMLVKILQKHGHTVNLPPDPNTKATVHIAPNTRVVLLGDLIDRGPQPVDCLRLWEAIGSQERGHGVMGNHDDKLIRHHRGGKTETRHGLGDTLSALGTLQPATRERLIKSLENLATQIRFDNVQTQDGKTRVWAVHAAAPEKHQGVLSSRARTRALVGYPSGTIREDGTPERLDWADLLGAGQDLVIHGHTVMPAPRRLNNVICLDTGAAYGGSLSLWNSENNRVSCLRAEKAWARHSEHTIESFPGIPGRFSQEPLEPTTTQVRTLTKESER